MDSYLERLHRELEETMTVTGSERMDGGPAGKWTPAQVLEHLFLTSVWRKERHWGRALHSGVSSAHCPL
jgi:hypothetical protein